MRFRPSRVVTPTIPTMRAEPDTAFQIPSGSRFGVIAGGGNLPVEVVRSLAARGHAPFVIMVAGEVDRAADFDAYERTILRVEDLSLLVSTLKRHGVTHLVLAGNVTRRPRLTSFRPGLDLVRALPSIAAGLARGDDGLLKVLIRIIESRGVKVVGPHQVIPELVAVAGAISKTEPLKKDWLDIEAARTAALAIGALDIGQAAVAIGGRAIALEGVEGTNGLLERVRDLRGHGRIANKKRGVLVKCSKPGQELRVDLPSIGPQTVELAHAAGLVGIAVEAGRSLVLEGPQVIARADALGLFVLGLPAREHRHGE